MVTLQEAREKEVLTGVHFVQGNWACAEGAIAAGCRFFAGYPITPSTEIAERLAERLPRVGGVYVQFEDEIASLAAVIGASYSGMKAMTATSGPGFSLMMEHIGLAAMLEAPCVLVNIMRGGPSTGQPTRAAQQDVMQCRWGSHGDYEIIAICPSSVQEMFDLTIEAFNLAEQYRVPVFLMGDAHIGHIREKLVIPPPENIRVVNRKKPKVPPEEYMPFKADEDLVPPMACIGEGYRFHVTGLTHNERGYPLDTVAAQQALVSRLCDKIRKNAKKIWKVEELHVDDADVIIVAYGSVARSAVEAINMAREKGTKAGLLRLVTIWPFPTEFIEDRAKDVKCVLVPELNYGQLVREVERAVGRHKVKSIPRLGEDPHEPEELVEELRRSTG